MGCGRVGSSLARNLERAGHSVAIIDQNPAAFRRLIDDPNTAARFGAEGAALARTLTWPATVKRLLVPVN